MVITEDPFFVSLFVGTVVVELAGDDAVYGTMVITEDPFFVSLFVGTVVVELAGNDAVRQKTLYLAIQL